MILGALTANGDNPEATATQATLSAGGHNPLIAHAFRPRGTPPAT
jgi:hypothetical protein